MPVYGGIRSARTYSKKRALTHRISRPLEEKSGRGARRYDLQAHDVSWNVSNTSLSTVQRRMKFNIEDWVHRRAQRTGRPTRVLDWGCENGRAISELANAQGKNVQCFGYGDENYLEWNTNPRVNFIQETKEKMLRFFKDGSLDIVYSHSGLHQIRKGNELEFPRYLKKLSRKLAPHGILIFNPLFDSRQISKMMARRDNLVAIHRKIQLFYQGIIDPTQKKIRVTFADNTMRIERLD